MAQIARENPGNPERWLQGGYGGTPHGPTCGESQRDHRGLWLGYCRLPYGHLWGEGGQERTPCRIQEWDKDGNPIHKDLI